MGIRWKAGLGSEKGSRGDGEGLVTKPPFPRWVMPGTASNPSPASTARARSTMIWSPSPRATTSTSGFVSNVSSAVNVTCGPPRAISAWGAAWRATRTADCTSGIQGVKAVMPIRSGCDSAMAAPSPCQPVPSALASRTSTGMPASSRQPASCARPKGSATTSPIISQGVLGGSTRSTRIGNCLSKVQVCRRSLAICKKAGRQRCRTPGRHRAVDAARR